MITTMTRPFTALAALLSVLLCSTLAVEAAKDRSNYLKDYPHPQGEVPIVYNCSTTGNKGPVYTIALDDGIKSEEYHNFVVDTFKQHGKKPHFFPNGQNYDCIFKYKDLISKNLEEKSAHFGSHGWAHPHALEISHEDWVHDVRLNQLAWVKMGFHVPVTYRFPYGEFDESHLKGLKKLGYVAAIQWNQDSFDSAGEDIKTIKEKLREAFKAPDFPKNVLWLNHETQDVDVKDGLLKWEFARMDHMGKSYVDLPTCLNYHGPLYRKPTQKELDMVKDWSDTDCAAFEASYKAMLQAKHKH